MSERELTPSQEAEHMIYILRKRADLALLASDITEFNRCQNDIIRLQKSTGVTSGRKWKEEKK
jgi:hypothetical protein